MSLNLSPEEIAQYRATFKRREQQRQDEAAERRSQGHRVACEAAQLLKSRFGASRVWLFGSMLDVKRVHSRSDIDLAVEGLKNAEYLKAVTQLMDLSDFSVDLVQLEYASPSLRTKIAQQGIAL